MKKIALLFFMLSATPLFTTENIGQCSKRLNIITQHIFPKMQLTHAECSAQQSEKTFEEYFGIDETLLSNPPKIFTVAEKNYCLKNQLPSNHEWFMYAQNGDHLKKFKGTWVKEGARKRIITRMLIEKVIQKLNLTQIKLPEEYVFFRKDGKIITLQQSDTISDELDCCIIQEHIEKKDSKMNEVQIKELMTLLRFVYLDVGSDNLRIHPDGIYLIDTEDKGEHFVTNWKKIWFRYPFKQKAIDYAEKERLKLQTYIATCIKEDPILRKEIKFFAVTRFTKSYADEPIRSKNRNLCFLGPVLENLFRTDEDRINFWKQVGEVVVTE